MRNRLLTLLTLLSLLSMPSSLWADKSTSHYTTINENENTTDAQTDTTLWTPASGFRFILQGCFVSADATQTVEFEVSDVDVIPPIYVAANTSALIGGSHGSIYTSAADAVLKYSTTTSANTSVTCWGYEDRF